MDKCSVCGDPIRSEEYEMPPGSGVLRDLNPVTRRISWMHDSCYEYVCDEAKAQKGGEE